MNQDLTQQRTYGTDDAVAFLNGTATDDQGRTVADYLAFDAETWERCHNHIQWAFPSSLPSRFNPNAPVVNILDMLDELSEDGRENLANLHDAFLGTLGISHSDEEPFDWHTGVHKYTFDGETDFWLKVYDHNHLRITRVLMILAYKDPPQAVTLLNLLMDMAIDSAKRPVSAFAGETVAYWYKAVYIDDET